MKKLAIILAVAMCLSALFTLSACNPQKTDESFVSIDINPSVEMLVSANGKVTSIYGSNEDGQVLLYGKTSDLEGKDVSQVVAEITDEAAKLGYISENNKVVQGVNKDVIMPATQEIVLQAMEEGLIQTFIQAGCAVSTPTCGPCLGGHMGVMAEGERTVSTTNRNFVGRMGHVTSEIILASPAVAAASAVAGCVADPRV